MSLRAELPDQQGKADYRQEQITGPEHADRARRCAQQCTDDPDRGPEQRGQPHADAAPGAGHAYRGKPCGGQADLKTGRVWGGVRQQMLQAYAQKTHADGAQQKPAQQHLRHSQIMPRAFAGEQGQRSEHEADHDQGEGAVVQRLLRKQRPKCAHAVPFFASVRRVRL